MSMCQTSMAGDKPLTKNGGGITFLFSPHRIVNLELLLKYSSNEWRMNNM